MKNKTLHSIEELLANDFIKAENLDKLEQVAKKFSISITPQIINLMQQQTNSVNPISMQFVPDIRELNIKQEELVDPIGDIKHSPVKGVVHRYPDRCLLKPVNICPVYCRFCFRREQVGPGNKILSVEELQTAYEYIANHPEIWEASNILILSFNMVQVRGKTHKPMAMAIMESTICHFVK